MQDWLSAQTRARPDGVALVVGEQQWTYVELDAQVARMAGGLLAAGVNSGAKVAAWMPNCADYVFLIHALVRLGAVLVPLNTRLTLSEMRYQIELTGCHWLVYSDFPTSAAVEVSKLALTALSAENLIAHGEVIAGKTVSLDSLQAVVFTSGTSGQPKGAMLTYGNQFYGAMTSAYRIGTLPEDRWLCCLPLYHVGGLAIVLRCCLYGTTVVLHNGFEVEAVQHRLATQPITLISLVPTMLYRLLNVPEAVKTLQKVRLVLLGGAAASPDLIAQCVEFGIQVAPTYGLTEACSQVATIYPDEARNKPGSVGKPLMFSTIRVVNDRGESLPTGEYGEIVVSGPTIMSGYYNNAEATAKTLCSGELYTGDIGYLDADGDLWLVQRRGDLIVSGGENVYPAEVEQVLQQHPAVASVCVVGVPSEEWGQQVAAAVVLHTGIDLTADKLIAFSRGRLAGYKQPRQVRFVDALPQTASGKILRREVAEMFVDQP